MSRKKKEIGRKPSKDVKQLSIKLEDRGSIKIIVNKLNMIRLFTTRKELQLVKRINTRIFVFIKRSQTYDFVPDLIEQKVERIRGILKNLLQRQENH